MNRKSFILSAIIIALSFNTAIFADSHESWINREDAPVQLFGEFETGFFGVTGHVIQISDPGESGDQYLFDYKNEGGQDILFPFERFTVGAVIGERHRVSFLYQPLTVNTSVKFEEDKIINEVTFAEGTAVDITYGFPFYRVSYSYDILSDPHQVLGLGAALQIRNASIIFDGRDGSDDTDAAFSISQNVGLVPALHLYSRYEFPFGLNLTADITGLFASSKFINGADFEFEGSILDASLRMGYELRGGLEAFGNLRFLGGTSNGTSQFPSDSWSVSNDRYTMNNLGTVSVTVGATLR